MAKYPEVLRAMSDYTVCEEFGGWPFGGGFRDQPHSVCLYFKILRAASGEAQKEEIDKAKS
jgi:hypothetical protein